MTAFQAKLGARPSDMLPYKISPWEHQRVLTDRAAYLDGFGFFCDPGTGKTAAAIYSLLWKYGTAAEVLPTLILCPLIVIQQWRAEFYKYSELGNRVRCLTGLGAARVKQFDKALKNDEKIFVTNYEALQMEDLFQRFMSLNPQCLVFDESHRLKNMSSKRTKRAITLADRAGVCRLILSGTPVLNSPLDLFAQYRILDRGATFGTNLFAFRATHFKDLNAFMPRQKYFPKWVPTEEGLKKINLALQASSMRVTKEECLDLPPLVRQTVMVDLSPEQKRLYDEMKRDLIAYMGDQACVATLALTKALRLQQIASGYVSLETAGGREEKTLEATPRAAALRELLSEIAPYHKVIIWAVFKKNYEEIRNACAALDLPLVEIHGDIPAAKKFEAMEAFNTDQSVRVLLGHPGSGGIGVNLVAASYSIFYSRGFQLEHDLQAESRNHRGGSEIHQKITRIDIIATGTIDEEVAKALADKQEIGEKLLKTIIQEDAT